METLPTTIYKKRIRKKGDFLHIIAPLPPQFLHTGLSGTSIMSKAKPLGVLIEEPETISNPRVVHKQERHLRLEDNI